MTELNARQPTGAVPWPLLLVEGEEKSGKSWSIAELSASDKVGRTLWLDLGEGASDEYGAITGARYEVLVHDGRWSAILGQVRAAREVGQAALDASEKPLVLAIDTMTAEWDMHKEWVDAKARRRDKAAGRLDQNPDAAIEVTSDLWSLANARHRELMQALKAFPGIVVITAHGAEVSVVDHNGNPTGEKSWRVDAQKKVAHDATVWVRLMRTEPPRIIGARSVHVGIIPGKDEPRVEPGLTLERLIFDILKCEPATAHARDLPVPPDVADIAAIARSADSREDIDTAWNLAKDVDLLDAFDGREKVRDILLERIRLVKEREAQHPAVDGGEQP